MNTNVNFLQYVQKRLNEICVNGLKLQNRVTLIHILLSNLLFLAYLLEKYRFIIFSEFLDRFCPRHQFDINILKSFPRIYMSDEYRFIGLTVPRVLYFLIKLIAFDTTELTVIWQ